MNNITEDQYKESLEIIKKYSLPKEKHFTKICCCCKKDIISLYKESNEDYCMWDSAIVGKISAGFGSDHDLNTYLIAICDNCITELINNEII